MKRTAIAVIALAVVMPCAAEKITNDDVIRMAKAGLSPATIELKIGVSEVSFDTSTDALIALKEAGVPDATIRMMIHRQEQVSVESRMTPAPAAEAPPDAPEPSRSAADSAAEKGTPAAVAVPSEVPRATTAQPDTDRTAEKAVHEISIRNPVSGAVCSSGFLEIGAEGLRATGCLGSNFVLKWTQIEFACRFGDDSIRLTTDAGSREFSTKSETNRDTIAALMKRRSGGLAIEPCRD